MKKPYILILLLLIVLSLFAQKNEHLEFEPPGYFDTYHEFWNQPSNWGPYNVHDPSVNKDGDWFYMYSTDVSMGGGTAFGGHKRRSKNLIDWEYLGTAFDGIPDSAKEFFLTHNPDYTDEGIWAPYLHADESEFRLYYSAPGGLVNQNLGFIGYATSSSAAGPWDDKGRVASSTPGDTINAIDPTIVTHRETGQQWMAYGSYQRGIYMVELDPATGGLLDPDDRGHIIARRSGGRHAAIEGPEIIYRNGWYYLFVSYDWLEDYYNVRVGRASSPEGPYLDFDGNDMAVYTDNGPMILFPYRFNHHVGWQGTGHNSVFKWGDDYFMAHQGRPASSRFNMVLHVRKMFWLDDWPVLSPQRYANVPQQEIKSEHLHGQWEHIPMVYNRSVPNLTPDIISLTHEGTINGVPQNTWNLNGDTLQMTWNNGQFVDRMIVSHAWDWENNVLTLVYTGMNQGGLNIWGKKIDQDVIDMYTVPWHGSAYVIRNHHGNKLLDVVDDATGANVRQWEDTGEDNQEWVLIDTGDGYFMLSPLNTDGKVLEVANASSSNGANIRIGENQFLDHQKWKLDYLNNGYFAIKSKISSDIRCLDVNAFSVINGANIIQWEYLGGINQFWRLERTRTNVDTGFGLDVLPGLALEDRFQINIFPNPAKSYQSNISIDLHGFEIGQQIHITIHDITGATVFSKDAFSNENHSITNELSKGIYLVNVRQGMVMINRKLIVL